MREIKTILELIQIYRLERPDIVHHVALKPAIYGTLAARITGVGRIVNAFGGLGHLFSSTDFKTRIIRNLISILLRVTFLGKGIRLILQNPEDIRKIVDNNISDLSKTVLIPGAGVNLDNFRFSSVSKGVPIIMYAGRLLWSKGVGDFVQAAEILTDRGIGFRSVLVGRPDKDNPASIAEECLIEWVQQGIIEWWGYRDNMAKVLKEACLVVLPSKYGEGVPKILIEAAAVGRPLIATNIPGCRDVVRHNINGLLVPPGNPEALADAIETLLSDQELRLTMGINSRSLVESEFSEELIINKTFSVYEDLLSWRN
jgi:glycosyltransferase involved in cell wall biosynthesis